MDRSSIERYEILNDEHRKSATSAVGRELVGGALSGPVSLLAGLSAKSKDIYLLAIYFKDGNKSLIEVDGKINKRIIENCF